MIRNRPSIPSVPLTGGSGASGTIGRWECDLDTERLIWSTGVHDLFRLPPGAAPDRTTTLQFYHEESRIRLDAVRSAAIAAGGCFTLDAHIRTLDGEDRWMRIIADVDRRAGERPRIYGVKVDITDECARFDRQRAAPAHDPLTGSAGPDLFHDTLRASAIASRATGLILVQVGTPRTLSGEWAGDACMAQTALRLSRAFPASGMIGRVGGDRFAVLLRQPTTAHSLEAALRRATMSLRRPVPWQAGWIPIDITIGAALPDARHDPDRLLDQAERALGDARMTGHEAFKIFGVADETAVRRTDAAGAPIFTL